jgi:hypothetical protein
MRVEAPENVIDDWGLGIGHQNGVAANWCSQASLGSSYCRPSFVSVCVFAIN